MTVSSERYRILMIAPTSFFSDYGGHIRILEEARGLKRLGHDVTIATYYMGRDLPGLEIVRTRPTPWRADYEVGSSLHKLAFDFFLQWTTLRVALRRRFDVVHGHMHEGALIGYWVSRLQGVPLIFDFQGSLTSEMVDHHFLDPDGPWYYWTWLLERRIAHLPDITITSSRRGARLLKQAFACQEGRIKTLSDRVSLDTFRPDALPPEEARRRKAALGVPGDRPLVVYLGLLADYQGTPLLLQAARLLKDRGVKLHFLVMGFPGVPSYERQTDELGIADYVTFTGKVPYSQAPGHLALGDIAIAPKISATEGCGKILNYMATGLPTVAFHNAVNREYLGELGTYARPLGSPEGLAEVVQTLAEDPDQRADLGRRLRERAARHFAWDEGIERLVGIYRAAIDHNH